jgi:RNA polymerase sigma-70 factor (ECF subfamily)
VAGAEYRRIIEFHERLRETGVHFLRVTARNFLSHEWERRAAQKRGGGRRALDFAGAEGMLAPELDESPDRAFDRQWALELLQACIEQLRAELSSAGQAALFRAVQGAFSLDGPPDPPTQARVAAELSIAEQDVANFLFRARRRLREILREHVRAVVDSDADVDDEIRDLFAALR